MFSTWLPLVFSFHPSSILLILKVQTAGQSQSTQRTHTGTGRICKLHTEHPWGLNCQLLVFCILKIRITLYSMNSVYINCTNRPPWQERLSLEIYKWPYGINIPLFFMQDVEYWHMLDKDTTLCWWGWDHCWQQTIIYESTAFYVRKKQSGVFSGYVMFQSQTSRWRWRALCPVGRRRYTEQKKKNWWEIWQCAKACCWFGNISLQTNTNREFTRVYSRWTGTCWLYPFVRLMTTWQRIINVSLNSPFETNNSANVNGECSLVS